MSDANDTLDAVSDEDLGEAVAESMISDAIGGMVDASQIEETGHTQADMSFTAVSGQDAVWDYIMGRGTREQAMGRGTHSGLPEDEFDYEDQNVRGPDYSQPDPFDRSNPEEALQDQTITDMEETIRELDERSSRPRNEG
jgi:hypothetical protein